MRRPGIIVVTILCTLISLVAVVISPPAPARAAAVVRSKHYFWPDDVPRGVVPGRGTHAKVPPAAASPACSPGDQLCYGGGGPVGGVSVIQGQPRVFIVYWGKQWGTERTDSSGDETFTGDPSHIAHYQQELFKGLGGGQEDWSGVMTQYCDGPSVAATSCPDSSTFRVGYPVNGALAGVWFDNSANAPTAATATQVGNEAIAAAEHFGFTSGASNLENQYVITSPPGTTPDNIYHRGFCAEHASTHSLPWSGDDIAYTNMPYTPGAPQQVCQPNQALGDGHGAAIDGFTEISGHEYAETLTDAFGGGWCGSGGCGGDENGDKCNWSIAANTQDVKLSTGTFAMQETWSNSANNGAGGCVISAPKIGNSGTPDTTLDGMWNSYSDSASCSTWSGGDATNSVALDNGERAWFFSDTYLNNIGARKTIWDASLIHNSIVMSNPNGQPQYTLTGGNTCQETSQNPNFWQRYAYTPAVPPEGGVYWTGDQMLVNGNVIKFYYHVKPSGNSFTIDTPAVATIPESSLEAVGTAQSSQVMTIAPTEFSCGAPGIIWGTALLSWAGNVYVYGFGPGGIYLAQTSASGLASPSGWQVYEGLSGSGNPVWGTCGSTPVPLPMGNTTTGFSVAPENGDLWLIQFDYTNKQAGAAGWIAAHPSPTPWGFTNTSVNLYYPPEGNHTYPYYYQDYEARLQPGLGPNGDVVISYNVNTTSVDTGCISANAHDATIYRPRFVDVPVSLFQPQMANPSPAGAPMRTVARQVPDEAGARGTWPPAGISRLATAHLPTRTAAPAASGGIDGATDWFDRPLGSACPAPIVAPAAPGATVNPDGSVPLTWSSVGTDVWYYTYFCDQTTQNCATEGTTSPWNEALPTPNGNLWVITPGLTIAPVVATSTGGADTSGHRFAIYVHSFGAGNGSAGGNSAETSVQVTVQPPQAPTGLVVVPAPPSSLETYTLNWNQVTYPSTSVYYTVLYCDFTTSGCTTSVSTWTALTAQLSTTAKLSFAASDKVGFCVQAENLGGASPCSNQVIENG